MKNFKIAIVHDWLTGMRGGEKCLEVFCELFPQADIFTLIHRKGSVSGIIESMEIKTSFLQKIPGVMNNYRNFLPLFPRAVESFDLSGYDMVLSSSHCVAKGARVPEGALHICYCYTPMRYAWTFFDEYFGGVNPLKRRVITYVINNLKEWDLKSNKKVEHFIAISDNVKNRIKKYYSRDADVIYPPVDIPEYGAQENFAPGVVISGMTIPGMNGAGDSAPVAEQEEKYYLIVSALVPYKKVDLAVEAFNRNGKRLLVVGTGSELDALKKKAARNVSFLGWTASSDLEKYYSGCEALIFPGEEDFGIVPVEAQSYGRPVIAFGKGGALETVVPGLTGMFFQDQTPEALNEAIKSFEENREFFDPVKIRGNALNFNRERFKAQIEEYVKRKWWKHESKK